MNERKRVSAKTRCGGRMTERDYWRFIRSVLKDAHCKWEPARDAKLRSRRLLKVPRGKEIYEYQCDLCYGWFMSGDVGVHHVFDCGKIEFGEGIKEYVERLFCESDRYQVRCNECQKEISATGRSGQ